MTYTLGASIQEQQRLLKQRQIYNDLLQIKFRKEDHVVELGCGPGVNLNWIVPQVKHYHGIDNQISQIDSALAMANSLGLADLRLSLNEASDTRIETSSKDAVVIRLLLVHHPDPTAVLLEAYRILKPGGKLIVSEPNDLSLYLGPDCKHFMKCWMAKTALLRGLTPLNLIAESWINTLPAKITSAGFHKCNTRWHHISSDSTDQVKLNMMADNWLSMIERVRPSLIESNMVSVCDLSQANREVKQLLDSYHIAKISLLTCEAIKN